VKKNSKHVPISKVSLSKERKERSKSLQKNYLEKENVCKEKEKTIKLSKEKYKKRS